MELNFVIRSAERSPELGDACFKLKTGSVLTLDYEMETKAAQEDGTIFVNRKGCSLTAIDGCYIFDRTIHGSFQSGIRLVSLSYDEFNKLISGATVNFMSQNDVIPLTTVECLSFELKAD